MSRSATHVQPGRTAIGKRHEDAKWRREDHAERSAIEQLELIAGRPGESIHEAARLGGQL